MNYRKKSYGLLLIVTLLFISIGYALIHTTLNLSGSSKIKQARWNIYFDKVENESGVSSTETKIDSKKTTVSFDIDLQKPGDYYQFNVDTVNDGTIDAIIDSTELSGLSETTSEIIDYTVTYADGSSVNKCDTLNSGDRKTLLVKVNHFKDINSDELLNQAENLKLKFKINYVQSGACSREPILEIDPNGGIYNESRKVTKQNVTKNTSITIPEATREGYNFINWQTASGVDLEKDSETHLTTVNMGTTDQKIIAQWEKAIDPALIKHTITINPNGGLYNGSSDTVTYQKKKNEIVEVSTNIEREGYIFTGWVLDPVDSSFSQNTLTVGLTDVTLTATWQLDEENVVAKIGNKYFTTLQKAFSAAKPGDKIELLKDITEISTNRVVGEQEVFLDLGGHTITGTINNLDNTNLRIDNGKIQNLNVDQSPVVNKGTLTIGTNDDTVSDNSIILYGKTTGLTQNGQFYFYDGYIEGDTAFKGGYNGCPSEYYVMVVWDGILNCQKAILTLTPEGAKVKVRSFTNGLATEPAHYILYFDLKPGIDAALRDNPNNPNVYAIKSFESSTDITINEGEVINIVLDGYNIDYGSYLTNNGTLTIEDTAANHGTFKTAFPIKNNNTLNLKNINLTQTSNTENTIENHKDINVINSTVTAKNAYALYNKNEGDLTFDSDTTFSSTGKYGFYNDSTEEINITGGNFVGIHNKGDNLIVNGTTITNPTSNSAIYNETGTITLRNCNVTTTNKYALYNRDVANIEGGTYETSNNTTLYNYSYSTSSGATLNITNATIRGSSNNDVIYNKTAKLNIYGASTVISNTSGICIDQDSGTVNIEAGTITTNGSSYYKNTIYHNGGTLNIKGGNITNSSTTAATVRLRDGNSNISDGNIISDNNIAVSVDLINSSDTSNITGGFIKGKIYGVQADSSYNGVLNIGIDDDNVDPNLPNRKPIIMSDTYGLYKSDGIVNIYDGIIKGKNDAVYYGEINQIADGTEIVKGTEIIDEEQYYTAYLYVQADFLQVYGGDTYNSLKKAINAISDTGKIIVIDEGIISSPTTLPSTKNITLDLNGIKIITTVPITNEGTLTIIDDSTDDGTGKKGEIENNLSNIINNKKTLVINDGIFNANSGDIINQTGGSLLVNNGNFISQSSPTLDIINGTLDVEGGTYVSSVYSTSSTYHTGTIRVNTSSNSTIKNADVKNNSNQGYCISKRDSGRCTIDNITISDSAYGIISSSTIEISNSNINVSNRGIYVYSGTTTVTNSNITAGNTGIFNDDNLIVDGANITGTNYGIYGQYDSSNTIKSGTIQSSNIGIYQTGDSYYPSKIILGNDSDETIADINTPVIIGDNYGIYKNYKEDTIEFYDGIIKSKDTTLNLYVNITPDEYVTVSGVDSDNSEYKTLYLAKQQPFIQVGDDPTNTYKSLQKAINAAGTDGTLTLIGNGRITNPSTIASTQNIKLNLNGYTMTMTQSITNNGKLTIENNNSADGNLVNEDSYKELIHNNNDFTIKSGNLSAIGNVINQDNSSSSTTIEGGYLMSLAKYSTIKNSGTITMSGGTVDCGTVDGPYAIYSANGDVKITGGTVGNENSQGNPIIYIDNHHTLDIEGTANVIAGNSVAIYSKYYSPIVNIRNGTITSDKKNTISMTSGELNIYGGTIKSNTATAVYSDGSTTNVTDGELIGKTYGLYAQRGTINIGLKDSDIKLVPIIKGETYGLYINSSAKVNYYDGILKGKTDGFNSDLFNDREVDTAISFGQETDSETGDLYVTRFLVSQPLFVMNKTKTNTPTYKNLQTAINEADSGDELQLIEDGIIYYQITFPNKSLTLDLNNHNLMFNSVVTNNGTLTIKDDNRSGTKGKLYTISSTNLVDNNKSLTFDNVTLENNSNSSYYYVIRNLDSSTLNLTDVDISGYNGIYNYNNSNLTLTNTNVAATMDAIYNSKGGTISITGGNIDRLNFAANTATTIANITIRNADIRHNRNNYMHTIYNYAYNELSIYNANSEGIENHGELLYDGGIIDGKIENSGKMNINNVTINADNSTAILNTASLSNLVKITNSTINATPYYSSDSGINNTGNIEIRNTNINVDNVRYGAPAINNYNNGKFKYIGGNIDVKGRNQSEVSGIINDSSSNEVSIFAPNYLKVHSSQNGYGLYNKNGIIDMLYGTIELYDNTNSYGIKQTGGEVILGTYDGSGTYDADVSTIDPFIKAVGTTTGLGATRTDGIFRFYDGKIMGSTNAKDFVPTSTDHENYVVRTITESTTGYEYAILECILEKTSSDIDWHVKPNDDDTIKQKVLSTDKIQWYDSNNTPISTMQYGALGNIKIKVDGNSMTSDFNYRITVTLADGSPIEVTNNNIVETMTLSDNPDQNKKDFTITLNCASPTADYTTIDKNILITITIEKIN